MEEFYKELIEVESKLKVFKENEYLLLKELKRLIPNSYEDEVNKILTKEMSNYNVDSLYLLHEKETEKPPNKNKDLVNNKKKKKKKKKNDKAVLSDEMEGKIKENAELIKNILFFQIKIQLLKQTLSEKDFSKYFDKTSFILSKIRMIFEMKGDNFDSALLKIKSLKGYEPKTGSIKTKSFFSSIADLKKEKHACYLTKKEIGVISSYFQNQPLLIDGDYKKNITAEKVRAVETIKSIKLISKFFPGDIIEVRLEGKVKWMKGKVSAAHENNTYDIKYDDGLFQARVRSEFIRIAELDEINLKCFPKGSRVEVYFGDDRWLKGHVININTDGNYDIQYDDRSVICVNEILDIIFCQPNSSQIRKDFVSVNLDKNDLNLIDGENNAEERKTNIKFPIRKSSTESEPLNAENDIIKIFPKELKQKGNEKQVNHSLFQKGTMDIFSDVPTKHRSKFTGKEIMIKKCKAYYEANSIKYEEHLEKMDEIFQVFRLHIKKDVLLKGFVSQLTKIDKAHNSNGFISVDDFMQLISKKNIALNSSSLEFLIKHFDHDSDKMIFINEFIESIYNLMSRRRKQIIDNSWNVLSEGKQSIDCNVVETIYNTRVKWLHRKPDYGISLWLKSIGKNLIGVTSNQVTKRDWANYILISLSHLGSLAELDEHVSLNWGSLETGDTMSKMVWLNYVARHCVSENEKSWVAQSEDGDRSWFCSKTEETRIKEPKIFSDKRKQDENNFLMTAVQDNLRNFSELIKQKNSASSTLSRLLRDFQEDNLKKSCKIDNQRLESLPDSLGDLLFENFNISSNLFQSVPKCIKRMTSLLSLNLSKNKISVFPSFLCELSLKSLNLSNNLIVRLPSDINKMKQLRKLNLSYNLITHLSANIGEVDLLENLNLSHNKLVFLPESIGKLSHLKELCACENGLQSLPKDLSQLRTLEVLNLHNNHICEVLEDVGSMLSLKTLVLSRNKIEKVPSSIGILQNLKMLNLSQNLISTLPESICSLENLKIFELSMNKFNEIPKPVCKLPFLEELFICNNKIFDLMNIKDGLKKLKKLILFHNAIEELPPFINELTALQSLNLSHNRIRDLPYNFSKLKSLNKLKMDFNPLVPPLAKVVIDKFYVLPKEISLNLNLSKIRANMQLFVIGGRTKNDFYKEFNNVITSVDPKKELGFDQIGEMKLCFERLGVLLSVEEIDNLIETIKSHLSSKEKEKPFNIDILYSSFSGELDFQKKIFNEALAVQKYLSVNKMNKESNINVENKDLSQRREIALENLLKNDNLKLRKSISQLKEQVVIKKEKINFGLKKSSISNFQEQTNIKKQNNNDETANAKSLTSALLKNIETNNKLLKEKRLLLKKINQQNESRVIYYQEQSKHNLERPTSAPPATIKKKNFNGDIVKGKEIKQIQVKFLSNKKNLISLDFIDLETCHDLKLKISKLVNVSEEKMIFFYDNKKINDDAILRNIIIPSIRIGGLFKSFEFITV